LLSQQPEENCGKPLVAWLVIHLVAMELIDPGLSHQCYDAAFVSLLLGCFCTIVSVGVARVHRGSASLPNRSWRFGGGGVFFFLHMCLFSQF